MTDEPTFQVQVLISRKLGQTPYSDAVSNIVLAGYEVTLKLCDDQRAIRITAKAGRSKADQMAALVKAAFEAQFPGFEFRSLRPTDVNDPVEYPLITDRRVAELS